MKRIAWLDAAKGILIVLVVLGHSHVNECVDVLISACHMGGFFLLSGITFHTDVPFFRFAWKKVKTLLFPYLVFSAILLGYDFARQFIEPGTAFDLGSGLLSVIVPISGRTSTTVYGLWFLPCLFLTELAAYGIINFYHKRKPLSVATSAVAGLLLCLGYRLTGIASIVSILPLSVSFLLIGYAGKRIIKNNVKDWRLGVSALLGYTVAAGLNWYLSGHGTDLSSMNLGLWPLFWLSSICGALFICFLAAYAVKLRVFNLLSPDTLYYYGLHYEVLGVVKKVIGGGVPTDSHYPLCAVPGNLAV